MVNRDHAVWFVGPHQVEVRPAAVVSPLRGQVLVEGELSAISAGTELLVLAGLVPPGLQPDLPTIEGSFKFPIKICYAGVGRGSEGGPRDSGHCVGNRVVRFHPHTLRYTHL